MHYTNEAKFPFAGKTTTLLAVDITDSLLSALEVNVKPIAVCDIRGGSSLELPADLITSIHYVLSGNGYLVTGNEAPIALKPDHMVIIPTGCSHRITSTSAIHAQTSYRSTCLQPAEGLTWLRAGSGKEDLIQACGRLHVTFGHEIDLFKMLDKPLAESFEQSIALRSIFEAILQEFSTPRIGTVALTGTLMKQCLILLLRRLQETKDTRIPWLAVLDEKGLQRSLQAILDSPEKPYRVEDLADIAAMSRSAFSERFVRVLGQPPHEFLSAYRLRRAAQLLTTTQQPVKTIAELVGFKSQSSFSRAFRARYDNDPAGYRRQASKVTTNKSIDP